MEIRHNFDEKHTFLPLLLLGDEQEDMIDRYLTDKRELVPTDSPDGKDEE